MPCNRATTCVCALGLGLLQVGLPYCSEASSEDNNHDKHQTPQPNHNHNHNRNSDHLHNHHHDHHHNNHHNHNWQQPTTTTDNNVAFIAREIGEAWGGGGGGQTPAKSLVVVQLPVSVPVQALTPGADVVLVGLEQEHLRRSVAGKDKAMY